MRYARSKNLTPYDVLTIASMIEKEAAGARASGRSIAAVIYNRLHDAHAARDRRDAPLRPAHPADRVDHAVAAAEPRRRTTRAAASGLPPTPIANPGLASIQAAAHPAKVDYLYFVRKPDHMHHFFTASASAFDQYLRARTATAVTRARRPARASGLALALAADAERRVRGGRARLALLGVRRRGRRSRRSPRCGRSASPARTSRSRTSRRSSPRCDEAEGDAVNTLVFRDGRVLGFNTDQEILAGIDAHARLPDRRRRRRARRSRPALPADTRVFTPARRLAARRRRAAT